MGRPRRAQHHSIRRILHGNTTAGARVRGGPRQDGPDLCAAVRAFRQHVATLTQDAKGTHTHSNWLLVGLTRPSFCWAGLALEPPEGAKLGDLRFFITQGIQLSLATFKLLMMQGQSYAKRFDLVCVEVDIHSAEDNKIDTIATLSILDNRLTQRQAHLGYLCVHQLSSWWACIYDSSLSPYPSTRMSA
eukprot:1160369-Pelagomonas_calceolata.AAC.6